MCSERRSELTVKCVVNGVFLAVLFAKVVFRGILRVVSKLTAEMPMRYACRTHVAYVIGQLRQMTHGGVFSRRHPVHPDACLFLSADFNPDDDDNRNDCKPNAHRLHLLSRPPRDTGLRPMTQRHSAVSDINISAKMGLSSHNSEII